MGTLRTAAAVASVSFLVQACVWTVISLLAILAHTCHFNPKYDEQIDQSFTAMAAVYFSDPSCWRGGSIIGKLGLTNGSQQITIASLQFVFNLLLAIVSLVLLFVIPRGSSFTFLIWLYKLIFLSIAVAVMDLVTSTMFLSDKDLISTGTSLIPEASGLKSMLVIVSLVAARGYLYWALNVILMLYLLITATRRLFKACRKLDEMKNVNGNVNQAFDQEPARHLPRVSPYLFGSPATRRLAWPQQY
uniref:Uncharacterized protein n=1 Tax=Riptortus pedestris TaxID=329032 RepID=R4WKE1_RIPPE|nr:unknown secreted protein [Riptortus pedestris]